MTNSQPISPSSANNLRLAPGRSLSSSAALLRQRGSSPTLNQPSNGSPVKRAYSDDGHLFVPLSGPYACAPQKHSSSWSALSQVVFVVTVIGLCIFGRTMQEHNYQLLHKLQLRDNEIEHHLEHIESLEKKVSKLHTQTLKLSNKVEVLEEKPAVGMTELQRKLFHMEHSSNLIQQGIQLGDRRTVREKFGPGPHFYVELALDLPPQLQQKGGGDNIILLETAALDEMPHSVHLFLEQVSHGLYDGTSFHRNAQHILQAGPSRSAESHAAFRRHPSLTSVLFQEYSIDYPHLQYTVGYAGRPGGPDFYINLRDNQELHGPGGQAGHYSDQIVHTEADPCFAKVVKGVSLVQQLHSLQVDWQDVLVAPVKILKMRVVPDPKTSPILGSSSESEDFKEVPVR